MSDDDDQDSGFEPSNALVPQDAQKELPDVFRWLTSELTRKGRGLAEQAIESVRLVRRSIDGSHAHVNTWHADELTEGPAFLFERVYESVTNDSRLQPGEVHYGLQIIYKDRQKNEQIMQVFTVRGKGTRDGEDMFGTEPASPKGLIAQQMRHNEAIMRLALVTSQNQLNLASQREEKLQRSNDTLLGMHIRVLELHKELMDKSFEREMEREDKKAWRDMKKNFLEEGAKHLPEIVQMFQGGNKGPGVGDQMLQHMFGLLDTLGEDGVQRMIKGLLEPDQETGQLSKENQEKAQKLFQMLNAVLELRQKMKGGGS